MVIPLHTPTRRLAAAQAFFLRCAQRLGDVLHELAGAWRWAAARRQMATLDDRTLRDLGVHRCELGSYFAESQRRCDRTRRRIAPLVGGRTGR